MYQSYPAGASMPGKPARPEAPTSVIMAVRLMYAGAAVTLVSLVISLATINSLRTALLTARPNLSAAAVHSFIVAAIAYDAISALITVGLWVGMAITNRAGAYWARIVASALFAVNTVFIAIGFVHPAFSAGRAITWVIWLIGLGALILLWRRDSNEFFNASRQPRPR
jgi:hypothetical protein